MEGFVSEHRDVLTQALEDSSLPWIGSGQTKLEDDLGFVWHGWGSKFFLWASFFGHGSPGFFEGVVNPLQGKACPLKKEECLLSEEGCLWRKEAFSLLVASYENLHVELRVPKVTSKCPQGCQLYKELMGGTELLSVLASWSVAEERGLVAVDFFSWLPEIGLVVVGPLAFVCLQVVSVVCLLWTESLKDLG